MKITDSDFAKYKDYIQELLTHYGDMIDKYDFVSMRNRILFELDDEQWLQETLEQYAPDLAEKGYSPFDIAFNFLSQIMCKLEGFENLVNDYLINNTNYDEPFANFEVYECGPIHCDVIPETFLSDVVFRCGDVHIYTKKLEYKALAGSDFNNHSLYIEEGCEEINTDALEVYDVTNLYLPKSLKNFKYQSLDDRMVETIHYNGTSSEFIELLANTNMKNKGSAWNKLPVDVVCTDKTLEKGQRVATA